MTAINCPTEKIIERVINATNVINGATGKNKEKTGLLYSLHRMTQGESIADRFTLRNITDFDEYIKKLSDDETMTIEKAFASNDDNLGTLLDAEIIMATVAATSLNKSPSELRKVINESDAMKTGEFGEGSINEIVSLYAREYGRSRVRKGSDWLSHKFGAVASILTQYNKAIFSNINKFYDRDLKSSVVYTDSSELINATEVVFGKQMSKFKELQDSLTENQFVDLDTVNKHFHLMDRKYIADENVGPNKPPEYLKLREALSTISTINKTGTMDSQDLDIAMNEMIMFKQKFDAYNYGLKSNERIWYDNKADRYVVYDLSNQSQPVPYNVDTRPNSHLWFVRQLGKKGVSAISNTRTYNELSGVEKQLISVFSEEKSAKYGIEYTGQRIKLDYVPIDVENGLVDLSGHFNHSLYVDIPKLSFLKERNGWTTDANQQGFVDNFTKELSIIKMVFSHLGQYELMKNTEKLMEDADFMRKKSNYEKQVFKEIVDSNKKEFATEEIRKAMGTVAVAKGLSMLTTLDVIRKLSGWSSSINNYAGGSLTAHVNEFRLDTFQYTKAQKAWTNAASRNISGVARNRIDTIVDGLMSPFSRQEAAVHNNAELEGLSKMEAAIQRIADTTADYGMLAVPKLFISGLLKKEPKFFDSVKKIGLRNSEKALRGDYWKGIVLQLVDAKVSKLNNPSEADIDKVIEETTNQYKYMVAMVERRVHGDFSQTSKSAAVRLGMMHSENVYQVLKSFLLTTTLMFKNIEFFSVNSAIESMVGAGYAFKESGKAQELYINGVLPMIAMAAIAGSGSVFGTPTMPVIQGVNLLQTPMTVAEITTMLGMFAFNGEVSDDEWNVITGKMNRISSGIILGPMFQAQLREAGTREVFCTDYFSTIVALNDPLRALSAVPVSLGLVDGSTSEIKKMRMQAKNTLATTPLIGGLVSNLTVRPGNLMQAIKAGSSLDSMGLTKTLSDWIIGSEFGVRIDSGEFLWGIERGNALKQKLKSSFSEASNDMFKYLTVGGE